MSEIMRVLGKLFAAIPADVWSAVISAFATAAAATIAAVIVVWQIGVQARQAIDQQRHSEALKLKLKIYEELIGLTAKAQDAAVNASSLAIITGAALHAARTDVDRNGRYAVPRQSAQQFFDTNQQALSEPINVIFLIERWTLIDDRLDLFVSGIHSASHDIQNAFNDLLPHLFILPRLEDPDGGKKWLVPTREMIEAFSVAADRYHQSIGTMQAYLTDIVSQMQNVLIGDLFKHRAPVRRPPDGSIVLDLNRHDQMVMRIATETAWGKRMARTIRETEERFSKSPGAPVTGGG